MKQLSLYIILLLLAVACYDDLGNYDYTELNSVTVDSIQSNWYDKYSYADTLKINPVLNLALGGSEDHLKFEWRLIPLHDRYNKDSISVEEQSAGYIIGREKNLSYPLTEKPGDYAGFFYVKDTLTGISYKTDFYVRLRIAVSDGWMVLCEEAGKARLDMISYTSENEKLISHNIWEGLGMELGKPYKLVYNYNRTFGTSRLACCESGTFNLDPETLQPSDENNMIWQFSENPDKVEIVGGITMINSDPRREIVVTSEGELFWRKYDDLVNGIQFTFPVNRLEKSDEYFKVSRHIGYKPNYAWPNTCSVILYDETNRRFLALESMGKKDWWGNVTYEAKDYPNVLTFTGGTVDYDANTGKDLVHMEGTREGYVFAVLKTPGTEDYDIYGMITNIDYKVERTHYMRLLPANGDKIIHFAFHPVFRILYYATEQGDVYQFNLSTPEKKAEKILSFPGERISVMKFQCPVAYVAYEPWERAREYWLYVAGYDTACEESVSGIFRMYDFPQQTSAPVLKQEIKQLGKIIDIAYRFKNDYKK